MFIFAAHVNTRWQPGIGDPSVMGWVTVGAYFLAGLLCLWFAIRATRRGLRRWRTHMIFWGGLGLLMMVLGVNKQLDLQSLMTQIARDMSKRQGWYDERRAFQQWFIEKISIGGAVMLGMLVIMLFGTWLRNALAVFGIVFLIAFILMRAASFHNVDAFIKSDVAGIKWNWILELSGIGMVALAAMLNLAFCKVSSPPPQTDEPPS